MRERGTGDQSTLEHGFLRSVSVNIRAPGSSELSGPLPAPITEMWKLRLRGISPPTQKRMQTHTTPKRTVLVQS